MSTKNRREFIKMVGLGTAAIALPVPLRTCSGSPKKPNIIFIMADDHAAHALSCYGSRINKTPHLDRIADKGIRFDNCFCTNSICAPSRASILTGLYSHRHGVTDNRTEFRDNIITFPELLQNSGYDTALFGKWHLKIEPRGFDYWSILPGQGDYYNPDFIQMGTKKRYEGHVTEIITNQVLDWLKERDSNHPFCLLYQFKAPHSNFMPGLKYLHRYKDIDIPLPETFFDDFETRSEAARSATMNMSKDFYHGWHLKLDPELDSDPAIRKIWRQARDRMTEDQRKIWDEAYATRLREFHRSDMSEQERMIWNYQCFIKDYLRCVDGIDDNVGRVLDYLDWSGLSQNTIVIYTSDQGFFLGDHGWWDKRFMYEESIRMPLLIRYPDVSPAQQSDEIVMNIDIAPTILEMTSEKIPDEMQGESFYQISRGHSTNSWRTSMYYHYYEYPGRPEIKKHYGVRTKRYKLIHFYDDIDTWELYDLKNDPHEMRNLYSQSAYRNMIEALKKELYRLKQFYHDDKL